MRGSISKKVTIQDVANLAEVSVGSVSNVINGNSNVKTTTEVKIRKAIESLGYQPSVLARSMRTKSTNAIGFIINDISNPLYAGIAKESERILKQYGYYMLLMNSENQSSQELELFSSINSGRVDAIVTTLSDENNQEVLKALQKLDVPIILLDREVNVEADSVLINYSQGISKAVNYLADLGHESIALISADTSVRPGREFIAGFKRAMKKRGLSVRKNSVYEGSLSMDFGSQSTLDAFSGETKPTAIISGGNRIFSGILKALKQMDMRVPEDISLIACDDTELTNLSVPDYTVLTRDTQKIGRAVADLLLRRLQEETETSKNITLNTELLVRNSCAVRNLGN